MKSFLSWKNFFLLSAIFTVYLSAQESILNRILVGKYNPEKMEGMDKIPSPYGVSGSLYMNHEALEAFISLARGARKAGFNIFIISAVRTFDVQKSIWEGKFNGMRLVEGENLQEKYPDMRERALKILEFSSMPGTSRHHWGTDIDIGFDIKKAGKMLSNGIYSFGEGKKFYEWMEKNALNYGFCQPYKKTPEKRNPGMKYGYQEEKWHWSYKPIAKLYLENYIKSSREFTPAGFEGSEASGDLYMDYVTNIDSSCR